MKTGIPRPLAHHPHMEARGLASLGRGGDSMLVHMSPAEVGGLQKLAMAHGGSLTINPQTGLPEASFLSSLLPMIGGAIIGDVFGLSGADLALASTGVAALDKMATGKSWQDAIQAGLQFYGGASLGSAIDQMSSNAPAINAATAQGEAAPAISTSPATAIDNNFQTALNNAGLPSSSGLYGADAAKTAFPNLANLSNAASITTPDYSAYNAAVNANIDNLQPSTPVSTVAPASTVVPKSFLQQLESSPGKTIKSLYNTMGQQEGAFGRNLGIMGLASGVGNALQGIGSSSSSNAPQNVPASYYVPAAGYTSLWNQGTLNPDFLKYGYLPPGEAMWLGQGQNPGTYSQTYPYGPGGAFYTAPTSQTTQPGTAGKATTSTPMKMREGGIASLKRFDAGGITNPNTPPPPMPADQQAAISQQALEQQGAMQHPAMPTNSFVQAYQADPTAAAMFMNELNSQGGSGMTHPSSDAMNQYLANLQSVVTPTNAVTGQGGYSSASLNTTPKGSSTGDSTAANTAGSITGGTTTSTTTDAGNTTGGTAGSGTSYGGNIYGATDPGAGVTIGSNAANFGGSTGSSNLSGIASSLPSSVLSGAQSLSDWAKANPLLSTGLGLFVPGAGLTILGSKLISWLGGGSSQPTSSSSSSSSSSEPIPATVDAPPDQPGQTPASSKPISTNTIPELPYATGGGDPANPYTAGSGDPNASQGFSLAQMAANTQGLTPDQASSVVAYVQSRLGNTASPEAVAAAIQDYKNALSVPNYANLVAQGAAFDSSLNYRDTGDLSSTGSNVSMAGMESQGDTVFGQNPNGRNVYDPTTGQWIPAAKLTGGNTGMASGGLAHGGLGSLPEATYAAGGKLLRGPGDGMSDSIPAVIHGSKPQRAALADGEFVIPADVVSHLGNGSTEAGSRKLYEMMDKIRHARTGRKQQAPAVKADKYLPA